MCGQQPLIEKLKKQNEQQAALIRKCEDSENRSNRLTDALSAKVLGEPHDDVFTVVQGFPDKAKLKQLSQGGQKSDYLFVRLLMKELWPTGVVNRSVTGRSSNNPLGRGRSVLNDANGPSKTKGNTPLALEQEKVQYCHGSFYLSSLVYYKKIFTQPAFTDRLEEHRRYLGDPEIVARTHADECGRLTARVIAYYSKNPSRW